MQCWRICWGNKCANKFNNFLGGPGPSKASFSPFILGRIVMRTNKYITNYIPYLTMIFRTKKTSQSSFNNNIHLQPANQTKTIYNFKQKKHGKKHTRHFSATSEFWMACCKNILASWKANPGFWFGWIPWWVRWANGMATVLSLDSMEGYKSVDLGYCWRRKMIYILNGCQHDKWGKLYLEQIWRMKLEV